MKFKKIKLNLLVFVFISFLWVESFGQDNLDNLINQIKVECEKVDREAKTLKVIEESIGDLSTEGGILRKFMDNKTVRKASLTLFGETGQSTTEYYFLNGELFFANEKTKMYKEPIFMGKIEIASIEKNEMYFKNQILVRWLDNEGKIVDQVKCLEKQIEILADLKLINHPGSGDK